jgi:hypothetical protein
MLAKVLFRHTGIVLFFADKTSAGTQVRMTKMDNQKYFDKNKGEKNFCKLYIFSLLTNFSKN